MNATQSHILQLIRDEVRPEEGLLPAFVYTHPAVYQLELERIFNRCWLFVAHESELPDPGDYVTRVMGERPVIVTRDESGKVRVMLNACRHRGMKVCRADLGNSSHFRCSYHGFTYTNKGALTGVPFEADTYGKLNKSDWGLIQIRTEIYQGLIFATFNADAEPLEEYLGDMRWYLDFFVKRAEMEVVGAPKRWEVDTTWKIPAENFMSDAYHTSSAHASMVSLGLAPQAKMSFSKAGYSVYAGNGHGVALGLPAPSCIFPDELAPTYQRNLTPEQFKVLSQLQVLNGNVFPNLSLLINAVQYGDRLVSQTTIRQWQPKGPGKIEAFSWSLVEKDAPPEWKRQTTEVHVFTFGTSGIFEQDDTEIWTEISVNSKALAGSNLLLNYQLGSHRTPVSSFSGPGRVYDTRFSEANARAFYQHWRELLLQ